MRLLILARLLRVYRAGNPIRELHSSVTILSTLPRGVAHYWPHSLQADLSVVAIIGIILLIACQEERNYDGRLCDGGEREHGKSATDAIYDACLLRFPYHDDHMAALLAVFRWLWPGHGSELRRPLGIAMVVDFTEQILTLYTTPVIYVSSIASAIASAVRRKLS